MFGLKLKEKAKAIHWPLASKSEGWGIEKLFNKLNISDRKERNLNFVTDKILHELIL